MKSESLSSIEGQDYIIFKTPDAQGFKGQCLHCKNKTKNLKYLKYDHPKHCTQLKAKEEFKTYCIEKMRKYHPTAKNDEELTSIRKVVRFLCENCVSINATQSRSFKAIHGSSYSDEAIRKEIIKYAAELKQKTIDAIRNKYVSIVVDGATINSPGWYCIGLTTNTSIHYYGCYHLAETTTRAISNKIEEVIKEIEGKSKAKVIGASSDNASNISNVFDPDKDDSLFKMFGRHIIRVPCQAHTAQLILASLEKEMYEFSSLRSRIQNYVNYLHYDTDPKMFGISTRCPPIRIQRWCTEFNALKWVITYAPKLRAASNNLKDYIRPCPITQSWITLKDALAPISKFTWAVEANIMPLAKAYNLLIETQKSIDDLAQKDNKYAKKIQSIMKTRWNSTADINLMQLCSDTQKNAHMCFKHEFKQITTLLAGPEKSQLLQDRYQKLKARREQNIKTTMKYGKLLGFDFDASETEISYILTRAYKKSGFSMLPYWEEIRSESELNIKEAKTTYEITIDKDTFENITEFYHMIQHLPSSEAFCERVFKNMRELFPQQRAAAHDDLVEAQTFIRMHMREEIFREEVDEIMSESFSRAMRDDMKEMESESWRRKNAEFVYTPANEDKGEISDGD